MTIQETLQLWYLTHYHRAADQEGLAYWSTRLEEGADWALVHASFSGLEQSEALERWQGIDDANHYVVQLYQTLLNRTPAASEIAYWEQQIEAEIANGLSLSVAASSVAQSFALTAYTESETALLSTKLHLAMAITEAAGSQSERIAELSADYLSRSDLEQLSSTQLAGLVNEITVALQPPEHETPVVPEPSPSPSPSPKPEPEPTPVNLDEFDSTLLNAFNFNAADDAFVFFDHVDTHSNTAITFFSDDDAIVLQGVSAEDVRVSVFEGNTQLQFDDGASIVSQITLVGVTGFFTTVEQFNATPNVGDITFA